MTKESDAARMLRAQREWDAAQKQKAAPATVTSESWPMRKVLLVCAGCLVPVTLLFALAKPGSTGDAQGQQVTDTVDAQPVSEAAATPRNIRPEIPDHRDPVVIAEARKLLLDENGKLKDSGDEWLRLKLSLLAYRLIESGHEQGVLALSRDLCSGGGRIPSEEMYNACIFSREVTDALVDSGNVVAALDNVYLGIAIVGFRDENRSGSSGADYLDVVEASIDKAESLHANPREIASLRNDLTEIRQFVRDRRNRNTAMVVGVLGALVAGGSEGSGSAPQDTSDYESAIKKGDADTCAWLGDKARDYVAMGTC